MHRILKDGTGPPHLHPVMTIATANGRKVTEARDLNSLQTIKHAKKRQNYLDRLNELQGEAIYRLLDFFFGTDEI